MDLGVQGLHPAVEHLGEPGDRPPPASRRCRPRGASPRSRRRRRARRRARRELARELDQPRTCRRPRGALGGPGGRRSSPAPPAARGRCRPSTTNRPSPSARTAAGRSRCSDLVDACLERVPVVVRADLDRLLEHDRSVVDLLVDQVHGHPGHLHAPRRARRRPHVVPGNAGSSAGWTFSDPTRERADELGPDDPHEAGERDEVDRAVAEQLDERVVERRPIPEAPPDRGTPPRRLGSAPARAPRDPRGR